jgi:sugar O-acyltransferase (sialic acid O-acetyltransferase NeuD family)
MTTRCIVGAGAQGRVTLETWRAQHPRDRFVFLDRDIALHGTEILGAPVVGAPDDRDLLSGDVIVALGDVAQRLRVAAELEALGARFGSAVHPSAVIAPSASIGEGTIVHPASVVHTEAQVGRHVIVNTAVLIEHDCVIEDGASLSPGVRMGGRVRIAAGAFLSTGVTVAPRVCIGANTVVGAGAVVVRDLPAGVIAYGVPARAVRDVDQDFDPRTLL